MPGIIKEQPGGQCGWSGVSNRSAVREDRKGPISEDLESCHKILAFLSEKQEPVKKACEGTREAISIGFKRITLAAVLRM